MLQQFLLIFHVVLAFFIIGLVLLQHGKGAEAGAAFGSGASQTVFGSHGSGSFLTKGTTICALLFAVTSLGLSLAASHGSKSMSIIENLMQQQSLSESLPAVQTSESGSNKEKEQQKNNLDEELPLAPSQ